MKDDPYRMAHPWHEDVPEETRGEFALLILRTAGEAFVVGLIFLAFMVFLPVIFSGR